MTTLQWVEKDIPLLFFDQQYAEKVASFAQIMLFKMPKFNNL